MACPFLAYRREGDGRSFDEARAYCGAADRFVQPMRADVCNDRYDLDHVDDCEIYREHADDAATAVEARVESGRGGAGDGATDDGEGGERDAAGEGDGTADDAGGGEGGER